MRILIIEDEPLVARDIENLVRKLEPESTTVGTLTSVVESKKWFSTHEHPDLILSDIQLSDGISFEIFESSDIRSPIIFTTAYDDYAIRGFKLNSIDYLLKPIDKNELAAALRKYKMYSGPFDKEQLRNLFLQWGSPKKFYKERFLVLHGSSYVPVPASEIGFFQKDQLIYLHTLQNEKFICELHALDEVEGLLDPAAFFRLKRQFIVNARAIAKLKSTHKGLVATLKSPMNIEIDVSREKAAALKEWLG